MALLPSNGTFSTELSSWAQEILHNKRYSHLAGETGPHGGHRAGRREGLADRESWPDVARRVATCVLGPYLPHLVEPAIQLITQRKLLPGGRYLYATARRFPQISNCFLFSCLEDSRPEWGRIVDATVNSLMCGGGVGVVYSNLRHEGALVKGMGGTSTGPLALMKMVNENARYIMQGGSRRSALWAGLAWDHPDIFKFIHAKDWDEHTRAGKNKDYNYPAVMDGTNMSVMLNRSFFRAYDGPGHPLHGLARRVFHETVVSMLMTGEPGISVDLDDQADQILRNACTESISDRDGDNCNLASINLPRITSLAEMQDVTEIGTALLLCGTLYGVLPMQYMERVRDDYRRIGLGVMGVHEWLLRRGKRYGPDPDLAALMGIYAGNDVIAYDYADRLGVARPRGRRAMAPNGTIGIIGETTTSGEPLLAAAYLRRYLEGMVWKERYVIDRVAHALVQDGVDPDVIEDAYVLAEEPERRVDMQVWLQQYVDQGISSTINLPPWGSKFNNEARVDRFKALLLERLPKIRGITCYPDGARDGQPLTRVPYRVAATALQAELVDHSLQTCRNGVCGT